MERRAQTEEALLSSASGQNALEHAIRAAELYMRAASGASVNKTEAARLRRKCQELISYAEKLKVQITHSKAELLSPSPSAGTEIIQKGSRLHGNEYPPWSTEPSDTEFRLESGDEAFIDTYVFTLSKTQIANFAAWSKPHELFGLSPSHNSESLMTIQRACDLVQDMTTDCSVVAGLSAAARILTGKRSVLSTIFYPYDHEKGQPKISPSGKYVLRMNFNGCTRRVVIDDRLPASCTDRGLFVVDRRNPHLIWPALLEKAYLKVRGGYDFPGSNSGTDLWVLTGWIPEQVLLQRDDFNVDESWARIKQAYNMENVIVTLGTGRVSAEEENEIGLISEHDYAVQDIDSSGGIRRLLVKNPWSHGPTRLPVSLRIQETEPDATYDSTLTHGKDSGFDSSTSGTVWFSIESVAQHFESMYLNWNPNLFAHRQDHHFAWEVPIKISGSSLVHNPQFCVVSESGGLVWILLNRHFKDAELEIARNKSGSMAAVSRQLGFMSILIFDRHGERIQLSDGATYRGPYVDSPQTLARLDSQAGKQYTVVIDQQELPLHSYTFTLSIFSHEQVIVKEAEEQMTYVTECRGAWSRRSAGGNASLSTYFLNPQYSITISERSPVSILLSTDNSDIHVHVDLVWRRGERAKIVRVKDLVTTSGEYRRGCTAANIPWLEAGIYTLVCSTFDAGQVAAFALRVASMRPLSLKPIAADAAGRFRTVLPQLTLSGGGEQWGVSLDSTRLTRASASAYIAAARPESSISNNVPQPGLMIRISIYCGRGPEQMTIAVSGEGEFEDSAIVLATPEFDLEPKRGQGKTVWLTIESIGTAHAAQQIQTEIFSDSPVHAGTWERQKTY